MVRCRILKKGPYSDYQGHGSNRKARVYDPGDVVLFPFNYAQGLEKSGLAEILAEVSVKSDSLGVDKIEVGQVAEIAIAPNEPPPASDSAIEFARDNGINLNDVTPTGTNGRIILSDVRNYLKNL